MPCFRREYRTLIVPTLTILLEVTSEMKQVTIFACLTRAEEALIPPRVK